MIEPLTGRPGWYSVRLNGGTYNTHPDGRCTCPQAQYRAGVCKHAMALQEQIRRETECPVCHGAGLLRPRLVYVTASGQADTSALPCALCSGSGLREPEAALTDSQLKALFA
jgi:hypothetical protein